MAFLRAKSRVLVLDDDVAIQKLVATLLKREGHKVDVVDSGRKALEAIDKNKYSAILLDLMMPHEGGVTVIRQLREKNPDLLKRVILLTGTTDAVIKSIANDVFAVVKKPFDADDLVSTVARLM